MKFNQDIVPSNLETAVQVLFDTLDPEDVADIQKTDPHDYHHGLGRYLRNSWSMWDRKTKLVQWFIRTYGLCHPDDISSIIIQALWCKVRGTEHDIRKQVQDYHEHWAAYGVNPATGELESG